MRLRRLANGYKPMALSIDYESDGFSMGGLVVNGPSTLDTSWDELLGVAVTVGRPSRQYVFRHGRSSVYEALFRWSLVRMALEQSGPMARRLRRTAAARTLDPSEKGAVNYFLGIAICQLFAARLLDAPALLHLDVFRPMLNPVLTGRSRPDLVGQTRSGNWLAFECKGRISVPSAVAKQKAKKQAQRLVRVNGQVPTLQIGGIAYFKNEVLRFFWRDPSPNPERIERPIEVSIQTEDWRHHYAAALELIRSHPDYFERMQREPLLMPVDGVDLEIGIHPKILRHLIQPESQIGPDLFRLSDIQGDAGLPYQADGVAVRAGESWLRPFEEFDIGFGPEEM